MTKIYTQLKRYAALAIALLSVVNAKASPYCTPLNGHPCASGGGANVILNVGISNTSFYNYTASVDPSGYNDFGSQPTDMSIGNTYVITASLSASAGDVQGWFDFDRDSTFSSAEHVSFTISGTTAVGVVTIPTTATPGEVRFRMKGAQSPYTITDACNDMTRGEIEDYTMHIVPPGNCPMPITVTKSNILSTTAKVKWLSPGAYTEYALSTSRNYPSVNSTTTFDSLVFTNLTQNTTYYLFMRSFCSAQDFSPYLLDSFKTLTCEKVSNLNVTGLTDTSADIHWAQGNGATTLVYVVDQSLGNPSMSSGTTLNASTNTSVHIPNLSANTLYFFHIQNNCTPGDTSGWSVLPFTTLPSSVAYLANDVKAVVYPNPTDGNTTIDLELQKPLELNINIVDLTGKIVYQSGVRKLMSGKTQMLIPTQGLASGSYFCSVTDADGRLVYCRQLSKN